MVDIKDVAITVAAILGSIKVILDLKDRAEEKKKRSSEKEERK